MSQTNSGAKKSFLVAALLSIFLGYFGVDRFYLGKTGSGIAKLLTFGGCGVWYLIDIVLLLVGKQTDKNGQTLDGETNKNKLIVVAIFVALAIIGAATPKGDLNSIVPGASSEIASEDWVDVVTMSGGEDNKVSETFTVGEGEKRIVYSFDDGSFFVYAAPEGVDIDTEGAMPIMTAAVPGTDLVEEVSLDAGTYNLDVRQLFVPEWTVTLQEKK